MPKKSKLGSSSIYSVSYHNDEILAVTFMAKNGSMATYQYYKVPVETYVCMLLHPSPGTFLNIYIKGSYSYKKIL